MHWQTGQTASQPMQAQNTKHFGRMLVHTADCPGRRHPAGVSP